MFDHIKTISNIIAILIFCTIPVYAEDDNYCHDKDSAQQWEAMAKKTPNDLELQRLHALRIGICEKIEMGTLSLDDGIDIFERERLAVIQKRTEEQKTKQKRSVQ